MRAIGLALQLARGDIALRSQRQIAAQSRGQAIDFAADSHIVQGCLPASGSQGTRASQLSGQGAEKVVAQLWQRDSG